MGESNEIDINHNSSADRDVTLRHLTSALQQLPAFAEATKHLAKGQSYRAYIPPEVLKRLREGSARLAERSNGNLAANILDCKTGEIVANASLVEVPPDLIGSLTQLATQQALADIAQRLEAISEQISAVLEGQHRDRLAEVQSGIDIYNQAIVATKDDERHHLLVAAIAKLNDGRNKLLNSTDLSFVHRIPRSKLKMILQLNRDIPREVEEKSRIALESLCYIVRSTQYLTMAYSALNEPKSLAVCIEQSRTRLEELQLVAGELARWLPPSEGTYKGLTTFSRGVMPSKQELDRVAESGIILELLPFNADSDPAS